MRRDDFEAALRGGLATLAREAIPDGDAASLDDLPNVQVLPIAVDRRAGRRVLAAVVALAVAVAAGAIAFAMHHDNRPPIELPPTWTKVAPAPLSARFEQAAVFTGREVIVWGGSSQSSGDAIGTPASIPGRAAPPTSVLDNGAAYDIAANRWRVLPAAPISARYNAVAAWTGSEMIVVGGTRDGTGPNGGAEFLHDGAAYDPVHNRWRRIPDAPGCPTMGTWTGRELVVAGACGRSGTFAMGAYDPARNAWQTLPPCPDARQLVSVDGQVFAWSGDFSDQLRVLDVRTRAWMPLPAPTRPAGALLQFASVVAYNGRIAAVGYLQPHSATFDFTVVEVFDPTTQTWRRYESRSASPPDELSVLASRPNVVVWSDGAGYCWFVAAASSGARQWSCAAKGPIRLDRYGGSLFAIGPDRFFIWGGRLAGTAQEPTNRPVADGAIFELP
jgi:Kelch motif protein